MAGDPHPHGSPAAALLAWYAQHFHQAPSPLEPTAPAPLRAPDGAAPLGDHELLERAFAARNGDRIRRLWRGDCSLHGGDHSRADAALVAHLWWWTGGDPTRTDRLFRQSALMRPKWDQRHYADGRTYGQATLAHSGVGGGLR